MTDEYNEGQAPPNYSEVVVSRPIGRSVTKIGQNPNIRPMVHNDDSIRAHSVHSVHSPHSIHSAQPMKGVSVRNVNSGIAMTKIDNRSPSLNAHDPNLVTALQVQSTNRRAKDDRNNKNDDDIGGIDGLDAYERMDDCLAHPGVFGLIALFGTACLIGAIYAFQNNSIARYIGWVLLFAGIVSWLLVGFGLAKLQASEDETPAWLIICCPCICMMCMLCAGDSNSSPIMWDARRRRRMQRSDNNNNNNPPKGKVIVSGR